MQDVLQNLLEQDKRTQNDHHGYSKNKGNLCPGAHKFVLEKHNKTWDDDRLKEHEYNTCSDFNCDECKNTQSNIWKQIPYDKCIDYDLTRGF